MSSLGFGQFADMPTRGLPMAVATFEATEAAAWVVFTTLASVKPIISTS